jgi:hypothetical protein
MEAALRGGAAPPPGLRLGHDVRLRLARFALDPGMELPCSRILQVRDFLPSRFIAAMVFEVADSVAVRLGRNEVLFQKALQMVDKRAIGHAEAPLEFAEAQARFGTNKVKNLLPSTVLQSGRPCAARKQADEEFGDKNQRDEGDTNGCRGGGRVGFDAGLVKGSVQEDTAKLCLQMILSV